MALKFALKNPTPPINVEEWRQRAMRRLPELARNYVEGGSEDLIQVRENMAGFARWNLRQRCLMGVTDPDLSTVMAGTKVSMPIALAPTGASGLSHWTGDVAATRAAEKAGTRACLSTASVYSLNEVADATEQNHWFQLYPFGNREKVGGLIDRAAAAGYTALFVTVDAATTGNREGERRAGMGGDYHLTPRRMVEILRCAPWFWNMSRKKRIAAIHYVEEKAVTPGPASKVRRAVQGAADEAIASAEAQARYMQADMHWGDLAWMRSRWKGPLYVKGVLDPEDAAKAVDGIGVNGVVVSNHGGRQLDRGLPAIDALPDIVARVGDRCEVYLDGGIRRGSDVITALALGARGVLIGRPYLYGLAAAGEAGVSAILEIFRSELHRDLVLMGCPDIKQIDGSWIAGRHRAHDMCDFSTGSIIAPKTIFTAKSAAPPSAAKA